MHLHYDAETEKFRSELRAWLAANRPSAEEMRAEPATSSAHLTGWSRRWQRKLFDAGLLVPGWPPELGGRNLSPVQQLVYHEEMAKIPVKRTTNPQGLGIIAPSILDYGSEFLKQKYLVPTLRAEIAWCLGMSEPGAGSDLAGLSTRAEVHDDHFVGARPEDLDLGRASLRLLLVLRAHRSRCAQAPRHQRADHRHEGEGRQHAPAAGADRPRARRFQRGVLRRRGRAARPSARAAEPGLVDLRGLARARARHGVALERRAPRRACSSACSSSRARAGADGRRIGESATFRDELASIYVDAQAMWFMGYRGFAKFAKGNISPEHSLLKLFGSEISQRAARLATEAQGVDALDFDFAGLLHPESPKPVPWMKRYLQTYAATISAGASEIQRNIIAQRVLGLPRR